MNNTLFRRRSRMLHMLSMGYSLKVAVETLSKENNCTPQILYKDHANMHVWAPAMEQENQLTIVLRDRLDQINREVLALTTENDEKQQLNTKCKFAKIEALETALKVMIRQTLSIKKLRFSEQIPLEVNQKLSIATPFEADPVLREALLESIVKQKAEKEERDAAKGSDATRR